MMPVRSFASRLRRFFRREDGTATIEFVLAFPTIMVILLIAIESSVMMCRQVMLSHALDVSMRGIRLGHYPGLDHDQFKDILCSRASLIPDCRNVVKIELVPVDKDTWALPNEGAVCVDRREEVQPLTTFAQGPENTLMLVRACVVVDPFMPGVALGLRLEEMERDGFALVAKSAFVNEPGAGI